MPLLELHPVPVFLFTRQRVLGAHLLPLLLLRPLLRLLQLQKAALGLFPAALPTPTLGLPEGLEDG